MARDYVAENLQTPRLDRLFPNMAEFDRSVTTWPWLRRDIDHPYRADRRNPIVGFINRDEASILGQAADPEEEYVRRVLPEKIRLAHEYLRRQSLRLDLAIIAGTLLSLVYDRVPHPTAKNATKTRKT